MNSKDVTVNIEGNHVVLRGNRENVLEEKSDAWFLREVEWFKIYLFLLVVSGYVL
jgi:HSP20 family molecular chaperone IbpA